MAKVGLVYHPDCLAHDPGEAHPESRRRIEAIIQRLGDTGLMNELVRIEPRPVTREMLSTVHEKAYLNSVRKRIESGKRLLDRGDTWAGKGSWRAALLAAGGVCAAVDAVMNCNADRVFCAVRPPGHHAWKDAAMGFCILNNVAVATRYLQANYDVARVAIIDWDVHHGNATQEMFYDDPTVFYLSIHQFPHFPGTGSVDEIGEGKGRGFNCNIAVSPNCSEKEYLGHFDQSVGSIMDAFKPEFMFISAGFDSHRDDPLADLNLSEDSFREMTRVVCRSADKHASGRIVSVLEGGYDLESLARSVEAHVRELMR